MTSEQIISLILIAVTVGAFHLLSARSRRNANLHGASSHWDPALVEKLLLAGANVNAVDDDGQTPLHRAADFGNVAVARALLEHGADTNAQDPNGLTPLHIAVQETELFVAKALLDHHADPRLRDNAGKTPLDLAKEQCNESGQDAALMVCLLQGIKPDIVRGKVVRNLMESSSLLQDADTAKAIVNHSRIRQDLERLCNALPHRAPNTENERAAAQYILERFRDHTPDVEMDDFYSPEDPSYLFASYYAEFLVVAMLNYWLPWVALVYGMGVFLAYITEFNGFALLSRFMPQYETQNVVARFMGTKPKRLIVVSANYDTAVSTPLSEPHVLPWIRTGHFILITAMVVVIVTCGLKAMGAEDTTLYNAVSIVRNVALVVLVAAGGLLVYADFTGEHVRGAVNNAAGVTTLLALAEDLQANPIEDADVWLVATGAKESWMDGMRHLVTSHKFDRASTYFLNIASAGAGALRFVTGEGILHLYHAPRELTELAQTLAPRFNASPLTYRGLPTDTAVPLSRGYKALGLMATGEHNVPPHWRAITDNITQVDCAKIEETAQFANALLREMGNGAKAE